VRIMCTNEVIKEDEFRTFFKMHSCLLPVYFPVTNDTGREFRIMVRILSNVVDHRDSYDLPCPSPVPDVSRPPFSIGASQPFVHKAPKLQNLAIE
jgi:hypothetical protein